MSRTNSTSSACPNSDTFKFVNINIVVSKSNQCKIRINTHDMSNDKLISILLGAEIGIFIHNSDNNLTSLSLGAICWCFGLSYVTNYEHYALINILLIFLSCRNEFLNNYYADFFSHDIWLDNYRFSIIDHCSNTYHLL